MTRLISIAIIASLLGCDSGESTFSRKAEIGARHSGANVETETSNHEEIVVTPPSGENESTNIISAEPAKSPVIVAGASLTCLPATHDKYLGCKVAVAKDQYYTVPATVKFEWSALNGSAYVPIDKVIKFDAKSAGTQFFVPIDFKASTAVRVKFSENEVIQVMDFDFKDLPKYEDSPVLQAFPIFDSKTIKVASTRPLPLGLGDGDVSNETDACALPPTSNFPMKELSLSTVPTSTGPSNLYLGGVCGLHNTWSYITIQTEYGAKAARVILTPGSETMLIARNVFVGSTAIYFGMGYLGDHMNDAILDDFTVNSLIFEAVVP